MYIGMYSTSSIRRSESGSSPENRSGYVLSFHYTQLGIFSLQLQVIYHYIKRLYLILHILREVQVC